MSEPKYEVMTDVQWVGDSRPSLFRVTAYTNENAESIARKLNGESTETRRRVSEITDAALAGEGGE